MHFRTSISQKLPIQLECKVEGFLNKVRVLREHCGYSSDMILNMDETPMFFDIVPQRMIAKKGVKEVKVCSFGVDKRKF